MARKQPKPVHQMSVAEFEKMFPDENACCATLWRRWPKGVRCPRCGAENPQRIPNALALAMLPVRARHVLSIFPYSGNDFREYEKAAP